MMRFSRLFALLTAAVALTAAPALAQDRGVVMAGVMFQPTTTSFTDLTNFTYFLEPATITGTYDVGDSIGADVGVVARVWKALGAGVAVTTASRASSAHFTASLAHPFFFGRARTAETDILDLDRTELGVHISAAFMVPTSSRLRLILFGGPSVFNVKQDVTDDIEIIDDYPYDTVSIAEGTVEELSDTVIGFHAGADVAWYFTDSFGVGGLVRFAQGKKETAIGDGQAFDLEVGGIQAGVGIRFRF
jgi:Outer membrane protein beta-barrel domain